MPFLTRLPLVFCRIDQPVDLTWLLSRWQRVAPRASDLGASSRVEVLARTWCGRSRCELAFGHGDPHKKVTDQERPVSQRRQALLSASGWQRAQVGDNVLLLPETEAHVAAHTNDSRTLVK